ncbi:MAG: hypothetical protein WC489_06160 [Patescibacteria group bacterium]|jgi:hypothetical protein
MATIEGISKTSNGVEYTVKGKPKLRIVINKSKNEKFWYVYHASNKTAKNIGGASKLEDAESIARMYINQIME